MKMQRENMQLDAQNAQRTDTVKAQNAKMLADAEHERKKDFETHKFDLEKESLKY